MNEVLKHKIEHNYNRLKTSVKWVVFAVISGYTIGTAGALFYIAMARVTRLREEYPWILYFLPLGGVIIVGAYRLLHDENDTGTNLVLSAINAGEHIPLRMAPLIFVSTVVTHLCGGSAGREGAALQLGGSIGNGIGQFFGFDEKDSHIMIMCGMSAAFAALFGTPMAAAIFSMEVVSVGIMQYAALVPCVIASLVARGIASGAGAELEAFTIRVMPPFSVDTAVKVSVLAVICALVSIVFCVMLHGAGHFYKKFFANPYVRIMAGGCLVVALTLLVGDQRYNGTGIHMIEQCFEGDVRPEAFLMKMIFTALTLGAGYKGGEIVPSFFTGATLGCLFGNLIGFSPALCSAVGMTAVFCGVTNCPITALLISFELFGYEGMPYYLLTIAFSYMLSGYFGLYHTQKIMYSKFKMNYINKTTQ